MDKIAEIVYREIPLTQGKVAIVDPEDYDSLNQWKWYAQHQGKYWYAWRDTYYKGRRIHLRMHRSILNVPEGMDTDHINGDGLDNRRSNLRVCTRSENQHNQSIRRLRKTSLFKGVHWSTRNKKWEAQIRVNNINIYLGIFTSEIEAAQTYDKAAIKYFGEFANTNFKKENYD